MSGGITQLAGLHASSGQPIRNPFESDALIVRQRPGGAQTGSIREGGFEKPLMVGCDGPAGQLALGQVSTEAANLNISREIANRAVPQQAVKGQPRSVCGAQRMYTAGGRRTL